MELQLLSIETLVTCRKTNISGRGDLGDAPYRRRLFENRQLKYRQVEQIFDASTAHNLYWIRRQFIKFSLVW